MSPLVSTLAVLVSVRDGRLGFVVRGGMINQKENRE